MSTGDTPISSEELRNRILSSLTKQFSGDETSRWLANLDDLPEKLNPEGILASPVKASTLSIGMLADKLFDDFQRYAFEFNKNPVGPDLMVQVERPTTLKNTASGHYGKQQMIAQGHILTRCFANVLIIYENMLRAFVIPAENLVAFSGNADGFNHFFEMETTQTKSGTVWMAQDEVITPHSLPVLSKKLFSALIKVATGEAPYNDPFNELEKAKAKEPTVPPMPGYRADETGFELRTGRTIEPGSPAFTQATQAAQAASLQSGVKPVAVTGPQAQPRAAALPSDGGTYGAMQSLIADTDRLNTEILAFLEMLDDELNKLTQAGIQLLQAQDLDSMQKLMLRTTALKTARDHIAILADELNKR